MKQRQSSRRRKKPVRRSARAAACSFACMKHDVRLRDRMGVEHRLRSDACCRNTLYHARPQNLIDHVPELLRRGVRHFRIELLEGVPRDLVRRAYRPSRSDVLTVAVGFNPRFAAHAGTPVA